MITLIQLTEAEAIQALDYAKIRQSESRGLKNAHGLVWQGEAEDEFRQWLGVAGEMVLAKFSGQPYEFLVNVFKAPDLYIGGVPIQVKCSDHNRNLIIRQDAKDDEVYVLVNYKGIVDSFYREMYNFEILGFIRPRHARLLADCDPSMWRDPPQRVNDQAVARHAPAIFVPESLLDPVEGLL